MLGFSKQMWRFARKHALPCQIEYLQRNAGHCQFASHPWVQYDLHGHLMVLNRKDQRVLSLCNVAAGPVFVALLVVVSWYLEALSVVDIAVLPSSFVLAAGASGVYLEAYLGGSAGPVAVVGDSRLVDIAMAVVETCLGRLLGKTAYSFEIVELDIVAEEIWVVAFVAVMKGIHSVVAGAVALVQRIEVLMVEVLVWGVVLALVLQNMGEELANSNRSYSVIKRPAAGTTWWFFSLY